MNKYVVMVIAIALLIGAGVAYKQFGGKVKVAETGVVREYSVYARKNKWNWDPETFKVDLGDRVKLTVVNEDDYDHGFAIDQFGISQRLPARGTIQVEFLADSPGEWPYYCSVACGEGMVDGKKRTHFDQIGKFGIFKVLNPAK